MEGIEKNYGIRIWELGFNKESLKKTNEEDEYSWGFSFIFGNP